MLVTGAGLGLLIWAGCPAPGAGLDDADRQKMQSVRFGIVLDVVAGQPSSLAVLHSPAPH